MTRVRKAEPDPHIVITDTSTLWHKDKIPPVDPQFESFWDTYSSSFTLELLIPEVVKGELHFQQAISAMKKLKTVKESMKNLSEIARIRKDTRLTDIKLKEAVHRKLVRWIDKRGKTIPTPISRINWDDVIQKSIWREPPFEGDSNDPNSEKGFRDAMILETVVNYCSQEKRDVSIAFLCKDELLRESARIALEKDKRFTVYQLIEDFKSYLDLTREKIEEEFVHALIRKASWKFFLRGDSGCLYYKDNVRDKLWEKYKQVFQSPGGSNLENTDLQGFDFTKKEPVDNGTFWISQSRFIRRDSRGRYIWQNAVTYVRQYVEKNLLASLLSQGKKKESEIYLQKVEISVEWEARITSDSRFYDIKLIGDEVVVDEFNPRTDEDIQNWRLEGN